MKQIMGFIFILIFLTGCTKEVASSQEMENIVRDFPEVKSFLTESEKEGQKTAVISEEQDGEWEVGVYRVLDDHMSTFNFYNLDENGRLVGLRDKYDDQGNFICSITTNPDTCR